MSNDNRQKLLGEKPGEVSINNVVNIIMGSPGQELLGKRMGQLALKLGVSQSEKNRILKQLQTSVIQIPCAVADLLTHYRSEKDKEATLGSLLDALKEIKLNAMKSAIERHYSDTASPENCRRINHQTVQFSVTGKNESSTLIPIETESDGSADEITNKVCVSPQMCKRVILLLILMLGAICVFALLKALLSNSTESESNQSKDVVAQENDADKMSLFNEHDILNVSSFQQFSTIFSKNSECCTVLNISVHNSSEWKHGERHGGGKFLKEVIFLGPINAAAVLDVLSDAVNLNVLKIHNTNDLFCQQNQFGTTIQDMKEAKLDFLKTIVLADFTTCVHAYCTLANYISAVDVSHIQIADGKLNDFNMYDARRLLEKFSSSVKYLALSFSSITKQSIFDTQLSYPNLRNLKYNIKRKTVNGKKFWLSLRENVNENFPNLEYFESHRGITYSDLIHILKCDKIKSINATVYVTADDPLWSMNAAYKGSQLKLVKISLLFLTPTCPNYEDVWRLGVAKLNGRVKNIEIISNCIVADQMVSSAADESGKAMYTFSRKNNV